ncbi:MAG: MMPL family transporter [Deltaproteobacteria bacterium]|nr:MMPL family transporter [Deltaproteobacteria bacterium]
MVAARGMKAYHHPWRTFLVLGLMLGALGSQLPKTHFVSEADRYLQVDDPVRLDYDMLREQFGRDDILLISITPPKVFDASFLETLRILHKRLEDELPWIEEVQSLINARQTRGVGDALLVDELLEEWPEGPAAIAEVERIARANPFYRNLYLSADGRTTGIVVRPLTYQPVDVDVLAGFDVDESAEYDEELEFLSGARVDELVSAAHELLSELDLPDTEFHMAGSPAMSREIQTQTASDMARFSLLSILVIALLLGAVFRRTIAVALPLSVVILAVVATLGLMAALGRPLTFVSQIVPSFILAVGVGFAVHLLAIFFQRVDRGNAPAAALEQALRHAGPAIAMSSLTTAGGMLSFVTSGLVPIRDIGLFVPFGVVFAATLSLVMLPAILAFVRVRPRQVDADADLLPTERILMACGRIGTRYPVPVVLLALLVFLVAAAGIPRISQSYDPLEWLPDDNTVRRASEFVDEALGGAAGMELIFDSGRENGLHDPAILRRIDRVQRYVENNPAETFSFHKTTSVVDIAKEIHQALHEGRADHYAIAGDPRLIAQELFLFENSGSDDLEDVVDSQFRLARISLKGEHANGNDYLDYLSSNEEQLRGLVGDADLTVSGFYALSSHVAELIVQTAMRSYVMAFLLITPLMIFFIGSLRTGLVSMAPNLMPIVIVMGVMGWSGVPLDMFTVLIAGIALGLVVDDTLHILHGFRRDYEESGDVEGATARTMQSTGRALFFTTVVLTCAFSIYGFASAATVVNFGILTALAVFLAFILDLFLTPALLALVYRERRPR